MHDGKSPRATVVVADCQPVAAEGLRCVLEPVPDLRLAGAAYSLRDASELIRRVAPGVAIVDTDFGTDEVIAFLAELKTLPRQPNAVVWAAVMTPAAAGNWVRAGAKGVFCKTDSHGDLLDCLREVARGGIWLKGMVCSLPFPHRHLTMRESQIAELVSQGLTNRQIARETGISPGTVKVHLKHIFEKTGFRDRYELALSSLDRTPPSQGGTVQ